MRDKMQGIFAALPTPMTARRDVDVVGLVKLLKHVLAGGVDGLWVLGSTSEFTALSEEERKIVVETCIKEARGTVPVVVGVASLDIRKVVRNAEEAAAAGADACFVVLPYYFVLDREESVQYVRDVAQAVPLPLVLYDNPFSTNVRLDASTLLALANCENLIAVKDSTGDFLRFQKLVAKLVGGDSLRLLQGLEQLAAPSFQSGAHGAVLALASIAPSLFAQLYKAAVRGDISVVTDLHKRVLTLCQLFELTGVPTDGAFFAGMKAALEILGICGRTVSHPFSPIPSKTMKQAEALLESCQVKPANVS